MLDLGVLGVRARQRRQLRLEIGDLRNLPAQLEDEGGEIEHRVRTGGDECVLVEPVRRSSEERGHGRDGLVELPLGRPLAAALPEPRSGSTR